LAKAVRPLLDAPSRNFPFPEGAIMESVTIRFSQDPGPGLFRPRPTSLPLDILTSAANRLSWASLMYALVFSLVYGLFTLTDASFRQRDTFLDEIVAVGVSVVIALAVFAATRSKRIPPATLIDIGLLFEVTGGFGVSFVEYWALFGARPFDGFGISWICVWIVIFPLIVPSTPGKTFLAALATASTGILAFTISVAAGKSPNLPVDVWIRLFGPTFVCTLMAFFAAKVVYKLGADVKEARRMGAYELIERLGRGGMGEVWRARHRYLSRPAAVKLISPEVLGAIGGLGAEELRLRFEREAEATASLQSPHSIVLYDFGTTETGVFYYVMELLYGMNLQVLVDRFGPVPPPRAVYLLRQVCHSLMDAHASGFVHRDIKPANIYLCRLGPDADFVKVLDFGLVKKQAQSPGFAATTLGVVNGTPGYMAPEAILGAAEFDPRMDLYAVGCVGYWLLTGQLVHQAGSVGEILRAHITADPDPVSAHCETAVSPGLEAVIMSCLEREPGNRIQTAAELMAAFEALEETCRWTNVEAKQWWNAHLPGIEGVPTRPIGELVSRT
jgi:serine/threonine-protein kinase